MSSRKVLFPARPKPVLAVRGTAQIYLLISVVFLGHLKAETATPAPEVFQAFAGGWLDYQEGHYIEAMRNFHDIALMDTRFSPAITGMVNCAAMIGLPGVGEALLEYEAAVRNQTKDYGGFTRQFEEGVAFWGLYTDKEAVDFSGVEKIETALLQAIRETTSLDVMQISPVSYSAENRANVKAYNYNILGLLSVEEGIVYLDLQLIHQFNVDTTQASGVGYQVDQSIRYKQKQISLGGGQFEQFFSSQKGLDFLAAMLTEGQASLPGKFEPKYEPLAADEFDPDLHNIFDLIATQANRKPNFELLAKFFSRGSYDLNTKAPITPYIYEGLVKWLIADLDLNDRDIASLMEYYLVTGHIRKRSEWGGIHLEDLEAIVEKYPDTPGHSLSKLHFLIRELTPENIHGPVGDKIEAHLEKLEAHPLINKMPYTMHHWGSRFFYTSTRQSLLLNFRHLRNILQGPSPFPRHLKRVLPLFSSINVTYHPKSKQFSLVAQALFPAAMIDSDSYESLTSEVRSMVRFHSAYLNGPIDPKALTDALNDDQSNSIYLTLLSSYYARRSNNIEIAYQALQRILVEFNAPEKDRISFRLLDSEAKRLVKRLPEGPKYEDIKASIDAAIYEALERTLSKGKGAQIRTIVSTLGAKAAKDEEALNDLESRVFQAADQADIEAHGWIFQLHWYWKWLVRHGKTDYLQRSLYRYDSKFAETIPKSTGDKVLDWQVRLPLIIAENYIHAGQLPDAERWLSRLSSFEHIQIRYGRASERLAEQALLQARAYLAAIALQAGNHEQAASYANEIIEWHTNLSAPILKKIMVKIAPELSDKTITNAMEAALAIKILVIQ